jgi:hypothetical protein
MEIDTAQAGRFLAALSGDGCHTFQTFAESKGGTRTLNRILHGDLSRHVVTLETLNRKGAGVFVMVNRGDGMGRKSANVTAARALFVDLDGAPVEPVLSCPLPPRIVVESSPGNWHCYWPVTDLPLDRFTDAQKALALRFDGDPKVHDRPRVMRLPGFLHNKGNPTLTRLVSADPSPLTWHEMVEAFELRDRFRLPNVIREGERNSTLFKLATAAAAKGVPEAQQLTKAQTVNARRCDPPLDPAEVAQVVSSAYRRPAHGAVAIPLAVVDGEAYRALDDACRTLLLLAYRRADSFGDFTLPHSELAPWFPREDTLGAIRKRLVKSGLLVFTRAAYRPGRRGKINFYRLAIPPFGVGYSRAGLPPFGVVPEALQAVSSVAPEGSAVADDPPKTGKRAA